MILLRACDSVRVLIEGDPADVLPLELMPARLRCRSLESRVSASQGPHQIRLGVDRAHPIDRQQLVSALLGGNGVEALGKQGRALAVAAGQAEPLYKMVQSRVLGRELPELAGPFLRPEGGLGAVEAPEDAVITAVAEQPPGVDARLLAFAAVTLREHYLANARFFLQPARPPAPLLLFVLALELSQWTRSAAGEGGLEANGREVREVAVA